MRINHNIQALNAYRNLSRNSTDMSKHLERLSSGLRINRAADDAAGLAISEKMRSQIRGLDMAERNTMDGISLIQTAEGALGTTHEILQRMRELAVQSSNGTLEDQDRTAIQSEIDQLTQEIDRIARTTQFNSKPLLRGAAEGRSFASTASTDLVYQGSGVWGGAVMAEPSDPAAVDLNADLSFGKAGKTAINGQTLTINGKTYELQTDVTQPVANGHIAVDVSTWTSPATTDADGIANINKFMGALKTAVEANDPMLKATVTPAVDDAAAAPGVLGSNGILTVETLDKMTPADAKTIGVGSGVTGAAFFEKGKTTPASSMLAPEASVLAKTVGVSLVEVPKPGDSLTIDDVEITFGTSSTTPAPTIVTDGKSIYDILDEIKGYLADEKLGGKLEDMASCDVIGNTLLLSTAKTDGGTKPDGTSSGLDLCIRDNDFAQTAGKELTINMQIGANAGENMSVSINVMDAASLGLARQADHKTPITNAGVDAVAGLDFTTEASSSAAIGVIDNAIKLVSEERSKLGAYQNRMEHTVDNLGIASENMTSAESRIRDADMASEMAEYTKSNIINQAATAMLAQANQLPQGILQLLK
ncbi:flagellin [Gorillibacterium sp. sgz500922]|uniref:flagellin N-terminal helical domain-containing protein n=1 Tax=Gorillibacterium sp. sgz500922 TaxID=3446694 RepID=UPI003F66CA15